MSNRALPTTTLIAILSILGCDQSEETDPTAPPVIPGAGGSGAPITLRSGAGGPSPGAGSEGGSGAICAPEGPFDGPVIDAAPGAWTWIPVPDARCRDGSKTGFGVRLSASSDKVVIYLEGGGACFNATTCVATARSFGASAFAVWKATRGKAGIFNDARDENPLKDWSAVYIPYCTGDIHGGDAEHVDVPGFGGPRDQSFVGYANIGHYLKRLVPTFARASQILLAGASAGGFGATYNYDRVAQAFCPKPVMLLDDSGPPMSDEFAAPCLQEQWKDLWNLRATLPAGCPECDEPGGGGIVNFTTYLARTYPQSRLGLISSNRDTVISAFFGFGQNDCGRTRPLSGAVYSAGLTDLRDNYLSQGNEWATYFVNSTTHTYISGRSFYTTEVDGTKLSSWVGALVDGGDPGDIGP